MAKTVDEAKIAIPLITDQDDPLTRMIYILTWMIHWPGWPTDQDDLMTRMTHNQDDLQMTH